MNYLRAGYNWGQTALRAAFYGSVALSTLWIPGARPLTNWCMNAWCRGCADGLRIRRTLINAEILETHPQAILVANHLSTLDIIVLGSFLTRDYRWLAKSELFKVPFSGWYLKMAGHIPVYRGKEARERNRIISERIHAVANHGASVLFFPEGTRSDDGSLNPFRPGAFKASIDESLPIIPLVIRGTHELMEKNASDLAVRQDKSCSVTVLNPIDPQLAGTGNIDERVARLSKITYAAFEKELGVPS